MKKLLILLLIPLFGGIAFLVWQNLPAKRYAKHMIKARLYVKENNLTAAQMEYEKAYSAQGKYTPYASLEVLALTNRMNLQDKKPTVAFNNTHMFVQENPKDKEGKIILAQLAFQVGEIEMAFNAIDTLLEMDPGYFPARLLLTNVREKQGRLDLAEEQLRYLYERYPDSVQALLPLAQLLIQRGQYSESQNFLRRILAQHPKNGQARLLMVDSYLRERKLDSAQAFLEDWKEVDPDHLQQLQIRKARIYAMGDHIQEAKACLAAYSEIQESNVQALSERAILDTRLGEYDSALAIYKSLSEMVPAARIRAQTMMYYLYMKNQNPARGLEALKTLLISDKRPALMAPLVAAYMAIGQENKALDLINTQPDSIKANLKEFMDQLLPDKEFIGQWALLTYYGLNNQDFLTFNAVKELYTRWPTSRMAIILFTGQLSSLGAVDEAAKILTTLDKPNLTQRVALMQLLAKSNQWEKAMKLAGDLTVEYPKLPGINMLLADHWIKTDKTKGLDYYAKELAINPDNTIVLNNLAWEFGINQGNLEKAAPYLEKLKAKKNLDPRILDTVGWILAMNGKLEEGEKNIRNALDLVPDYPSFQYHMGYILVKLGKKEEARKYLEGALGSKTPFEERKDAEKLVAQPG